MPQVLQTPNGDAIREACSAFDAGDQAAEEALHVLFALFPGNSNLSQVLLKAASLNLLYSTNIFAIREVARHIQTLSGAIDPVLSVGSPEAVPLLANITIGGKARNNYSFASKYCSWQNPERYPIWDSRVDRYLWMLQKQDHFADGFTTNSDLWNYASFQQIVNFFRDFYELAEFTLKEIDKFL